MSDQERKAAAPAAPQASQGAAVEAERDQLRAAQVAAVMPLIGPLLDAWEQADREVMDEEPELVKWLKAINAAMETAGDKEQTERQAVLSEEQIDVFMPEPDGCADADEKPVAINGMIGYESTSVDAWSKPLVRRAIRAALATQQAEQREQDLLEANQSLRDMLDDARAELAAVRQALGVTHEPHQSLQERTLLAAKQAEGEPLSQAAQDVLEERQRQIEREGYTRQLDADMHDSNDLARAAAFYAMAEVGHEYGRVAWPWDEEGCKVKDRYRNFIRAAALLIAAADVERARSTAHHVPVQGSV